jgi:hypothetical protein
MLSRHRLKSRSRLSVDLAFLACEFDPGQLSSPLPKVVNLLNTLNQRQSHSLNLETFDSFLVF